jgi:hypothetical protein
MMTIFFGKGTSSGLTPMLVFTRSFVAAAEGCVRVRSARHQIRSHAQISDQSERPKWQVL